ncbi:RHS repeat-associated core domain-containing protein [Dyella mobilis]|uniref:RHS repeat-associated core domain-containing protein n=1 Tax=Dyella mobilis TaxID=1849582 RepID=A0ABS2KCX3_9GAMM|nr:RHS repeat-associated core domain-containing protein [Dyella mobilis]MBM7128794.1 RHS repeat-associated core domain-containing protein [Dyella mobilis]
MDVKTDREGQKHVTANEKRKRGALVQRALRWMASLMLFASLHAVAQTTGTVTYVYTDPQGTPLAEADINGNITATFDYTPYGTYAPAGTSNPGTVPNGPGYTGHVNDPETNLVYMQHRYYDQATGRFLSVDPVEPAAANTFNFNRYDYVDNNPVNHIDPDGRCVWDGCILEIAVVGAFVGGGIDFGVQKYFHPNQPVNKTEVAISALGGAVTGGSGAALTGAATAGTITVTQAVLRQAAISGTVGAASSAANDIAGGKKPSAQAALNAAGANIAGSFLSSAISSAAGDFAGATANGAMNDMSQAAINTPAGIGTTISNTTKSVGDTAVRPGILQATASQSSRVGDVAGAVGSEKLNENQE